jgi:sarcosine/dimethylglycine N-methyltransferase
MAPGTRVADFCAGLGGPARYFAARYGALVTAIDLNPGRVRGARELTHRVGLQERVRIIRGDVAQVPLADASMDVVVSQEALLHVPDKGAALAEAFRILAPGGRLAFTDWVAHRPLAAVDAATMWRGLAAQTVQSLDDYRTLLTRLGFRVRSVEDLTAERGAVLRERLAMYRRLRLETSAAGLPAGDEEFYLAYVKLVDLVQGRVLGGGRFVAEKPANAGRDGASGRCSGAIRLAERLALVPYRP